MAHTVNDFSVFLLDKHAIPAAILSDMLTVFPNKDGDIKCKGLLESVFKKLGYFGVIEAPTTVNKAKAPPQFFSIYANIACVSPQAITYHTMNYTCASAVDTNRTKNTDQSTLLICGRVSTRNVARSGFQTQYPNLPDVQDSISMWGEPLQYHNLPGYVSPNVKHDIQKNPVEFIQNFLKVYQGSRWNIAGMAAGMALSVMTQRIGNSLPTGKNGIVPSGVVSPYGHLIVTTLQELVCPGGVLKLDSANMAGPSQSRYLVDKVLDKNLNKFCRAAGIEIGPKEGWSANVKAQIARKLIMDLGTYQSGDHTR